MIKLLYPKFWSKKDLLSYVFIPISWIYIFLGVLRKLFSTPIKLPGKVICVGNMSVGGAGKTQIVLWLAKKFTKSNVNFLIVTKGYGSSLVGAKIVDKTDSAANVGDESMLLSEYAPVLAAKNISSAEPFIRKLQPDIIIFDDGMQNPSFIKDLNILVIDANRAVGNGKIFPAGPLRQSVDSALSQSDRIIMIGNDEYSDRSLIQNIIATKKPFQTAKIRLENALDLKKKYYAFTAIGNPDKFYNLLKENNTNIERIKSFPDHHNYSKSEINELTEEAKQAGYSLITTKKDYVKLSNNPKIICADVVLDLENEQKLFGLIYEKI